MDIQFEFGQVPNLNWVNLLRINQSNNSFSKHNTNYISTGEELFNSWRSLNAESRFIDLPTFVRRRQMKISFILDV